MPRLTPATAAAMSFALACAVAAAATTSADAQQLRRMTIGTNPQGTIYYTIGGGFSKLWSDKLGISATAQPYAGSSIYMPLIDRGEVVAGLNSSVDLGMARSGQGSFKGSGGLKRLRVMAKFWSLPYTYFAKASSGMTKISDLKGKRVTVAMRANVALEFANRATLKAGGIDPDKDIRSITITGIPEAYKLVTEGGADAGATALGIPLARQAHATIPGGLVMLDVSGPNATTEHISKLFAGMYMMKAKPNPNWPGVTKEINIAGYDTFVTVGEKVSTDDVYKLVKTLHENWEGLRKDFPPLRSTPTAQLSKPSNTVPYHPGAIRYYKEKGMWSADNDRQEASFK